jgi:hypothetical protein
METNINNILHEQAKKIPYLDDHDWVFRSDGVFSPEIRSEYFGGKEAFSDLSKEQKKRFFEKILADYFTRWIDPQKMDAKSIEKLEEDYDIFLRTKIMQYIPDYTQLELFSIERGMLNMKVGGRNIRLNLIAEKVGDIDPRKIKLQQSIQRDTDVLRDKISTESYMWGTLIVTYEKLSDPIKDTAATIALAGVATYGAIGTAQVWHSMLRSWVEVTRNIMTRVRRIGFRNQFGKVEFITPSEWSQLDSPQKQASHKKAILTELQNQGIVVDVPGKSFGRSSLTALSKTKLSILNLTYESFLRESWQVDSRDLRKSFADWKTSCLSEMNDIENTYIQSPEKWRSLLSKFLLRWEWERGIGKITGRAIWAGMHWLFWPIFWKKYHANTQDSAMLYASLAEAGLFTLGAKVGSRVPWVFKPIASIMAWGMAVVWWEFAWGHIWLDKRWWKYYPDREDESFKDTGKDGKSVIANIVTMGELNAIVDKADTDVRIWKREWWDIRVPDWMSSIPWMKWARDITLPHIDILRKSVDLNTPPWEWMWKSITRNKDYWNKEVMRYSETLRKDIFSLISQFEQEIGIFRMWNIERQRKSVESSEDTKLRILERRLKALFPSSSPDAYNGTVTEQIIAYTIQLIREKDLSKESSLWFFIDSVIHTHMYLENWTLVNQARFVRQNREDILSKREGEPVWWLLFEFASEFSDPALKTYILSLFDRIREKKRLVNISSLDQPQKLGKILEQSPNGYWIETPEFLWQKWKKWVNTKEWVMFQSLLNSKEKVSSPLFGTLFWDNISRWDVFYRLLNMMVENKRREEFVRNVVTSDMAQKWKLF